MKKVLVPVLLLFGCISAHAQSSATIWFYRPANSSGPIRTVYQIAGITDRIATIAPGEFFGLRVSPGVQVFSYTQAPARGQSIAVSVNQGQQAYVEVREDNFEIVSQDRGIQAIQSSRAIPTTSAINNNVIVAASGPAPVAFSAPIVTTSQQAPAPSPTASRIEQQGSVEPSSANEFRRFEINWNILSYSRQGSSINMEAH
jgi:hypothetical protein